MQPEEEEKFFSETSSSSTFSDLSEDDGKARKSEESSDSSISGGGSIGGSSGGSIGGSSGGGGGGGGNEVIEITVSGADGGVSSNVGVGVGLGGNVGIGMGTGSSRLARSNARKSIELNEVLLSSGGGSTANGETITTTTTTTTTASSTTATTNTITTTTTTSTKTRRKEPNSVRRSASPFPRDATSSPGREAKPVKAHDVLLLSSLTLGSPDWESWSNADPLQMWYYIPLFLRVLRPLHHHDKWNLPDRFYQAIKPLFHHEVDESIRQLTFWMSLLKMLPSEASKFFGDPESDQKSTQKFFHDLGSKKLKGGEEFTFETTITTTTSNNDNSTTTTVTSTTTLLTTTITTTPTMTNTNASTNTGSATPTSASTPTPSTSITSNSLPPLSSSSATTTTTTTTTATTTTTTMATNSTPTTTTAPASTSDTVTLTATNTTNCPSTAYPKICDPIFGVPSPIVNLKIVSLFKAHTRPALCEVTYRDAELPKRRFIYKKGDDLRDDMYTQVMFFVFNKIWEHSNLELKPFIHQYRVFPTSHDTGFVEFVPSKTAQSYDWNLLDTFTKQQKFDFICSAAGAFAGAFILGIRDRHRDNMMISNVGHFFHIDFGYMFNNKTWFDANRFAIPTEIRTKLPDQWEKFLELIGEAYRLLRRNRGMITFFVTKLFGSLKKPAGVKKFNEAQIIKCLVGAFYDQMTEEEAVLHVRDVASKGEASPKKALKDLVHKFESKKKKI